MQIKDLTTDEFKTLLKEAFAEVLQELLNDPDENQELQEEVKQQLIEYKRERAAGVRGIPAEEVARKLGLY